MSSLSTAAHEWLATGKTRDGATVAVIDGGVAAARRTGVGHHVADAAEVTVGDVTTLAARWLCGGSSVDAVLLADDTPDCVSCRLAAATPRCPCVYYARDASGELLYIGSSVNVAQRIRGHMSQTAWWSEVRRLTFEEYPTEIEARRAEYAAIGKTPGVYNREARRPPAGDDSVLSLVMDTPGASA